MTFKTGSWGFQAKERGKKRTKYFNEYRKRFPEKWIAHNKVQYALKRGVIKKEKCFECGDPMAQAHHEDYTKPLLVIWLCKKHHRERHR